MKKSTLFTLLASAVVSNALQQNPLEHLIRKRLDSGNILPVSEEDELLDTFFGRIIEAEFSYAYSLSFSYLHVPDSSPPPTVSKTEVPSSSPTITNSVRTTLVPTPFSDSSNDESSAPSHTSNATEESTDKPSSVISKKPSNEPSGAPAAFPLSLVPSTNSSDARFSEGGGETESVSSVDNLSTRIAQAGPDSTLVVALVGVATVLIIVGTVAKVKRRQNENLLYRNLDGDSHSSFSLQA
jgi:hypothetical protein